MEFLQEWGHIGLFLGAFLAATVIPFSPDFLLIGVLVAGGSPLLALIFSSMGSWMGSLTTYGLGYLGKWEWIRKWFKISPEQLEKQKAKVDKYRYWLALFIWVPMVGDAFALALGFYKVKFIPTALLIFVGKFFRSLFWVLLYQWASPIFH